MDRGTFQSCSSPSCHAGVWTDDKAQNWSGTPLWLLAGRIDDEVKHGDGSFNGKLADQGYVVEVVAADGYSVTFDSARLKRNRNIIVAYLVNNNPLDDKYFPLRLVGSDLKNNEMVGQIAKINLRLAIQAASAKPTETPQPVATPTTAPTSVPAAKGNAALAITGAVDKQQSLTLDALKAMQVVKLKAEHPKKGMQDYEGVRLNALLDQAQVKSSATKLLLTSSDGFTVQVTLTEARKCADCLLAFSADKLDAVMPGMPSNLWVKDVVKVEVK